METLGDRIKKIRRIKELTQTAFADRIGSAQNTVTRYETGDRTPSTAVREMICREFGVNRQWLETGEGEMFTVPNEEPLKQIALDYGLNENDIAAIKSFLELPPEYRRGVIEWGKKFAAKMAVEMGIEFSIRDEVRKTDDELTPDEAADMVRMERQAQLDARKRGITTSSASTGTNGASKKFGNRLE